MQFSSVQSISACLQIKGLFSKTSSRSARERKWSHQLSTQKENEAFQRHHADNDNDDGDDDDDDDDAKWRW